jgi:hypothetical protein
MARTARVPKDDSGVVAVKDFAGAVRTWRNDIKPAISKQGEHGQEASTGYKHIKKNCHIQPQAARTAFKLADMEDAKRDDYLRCFIGLLKEMNIPLESNDLVDMAERPKPQLVTISPPVDHPDDDSDLASPEGEEPADGTGAAALAAMRAADEAEAAQIEVPEDELTH